MGRIMENLRDMKDLGFIAVLILSSLLLILPAMGADFNVTVDPNELSSKDIDYTVLNLTINNTDENTSIVQVIVYLVNTEFQFIPGNTSNGSSLDPGIYNFTALTDNRELIWENTTNEILVDDGEEQYFWFNTSIPSNSGSYIITIKTIDDDLVENSINNTITIDNSAPVITINSPENNIVEPVKSATKVNMPRNQP